MAVLNIPTFSDPFYTFTCALEGTVYVFDWRYNQREDAWRFSISLPDGTDLVSGIKVVCGKSLLKRTADVRLPAGLLMAISNNGDTSTPGLEELGEGKRVTLVYVTSDDASL